MTKTRWTNIEHWRALGVETGQDVREIYERVRRPTFERGKLSQITATAALERARYLADTRRTWLRAAAADVARGDYSEAARHARLAAEIA